MAFGLGFVLGPLLGGVLLSLPLADDWRLRLPFLVAAGFSTLAWVLVLTRLPESRPQGEPAREAARVSSWRGIVDTISAPGIGRLILIGFLAVFAFAAFEGTFALFLLRRMKWDARTAAFAFAGIGFLSAMVQGGLIRRLVPRFGEARLIVTGLVLAACGFAGMALVSECPRAGWFHDAAWHRARTAQSVRLGVALADHADEPTGGRFRHAHVGADSCSDDQLLGIECLARQGRPPRRTGERSASTWSPSLVASSIGRAPGSVRTPGR